MKSTHLSPNLASTKNSNLEILQIQPILWHNLRNLLIIKYLPRSIFASPSNYSFGLGGETYISLILIKTLHMPTPTNETQNQSSFQGPAAETEVFESQGVGFAAPTFQ